MCSLDPLPCRRQRDVTVRSAFLKRLELKLGRRLDQKWAQGLQLMVRDVL
jgi:hypothetical protein